jgi:hypothetical protein
MAKLLGKIVGQSLVEFLGPITGRNYNVSGAAAPVAPRIIIQVFGTGSVQMQQNGSSIIIGNDGGNVFTSDTEAAPTTWVALGGVISQASGQVVVNPAVNPNWGAIRAIVAVVGEGRVVVETDWN